MIIGERERTVLKETFPKILREMAVVRPHAIVFLDTSARPFGWLAQRLWHELNPDVHKPKILFLSPPKSRTELVKFRASAANWSKKNKLEGKDIVIFDDVAGRQLRNVTGVRRSIAGTKVTKAALVTDRAPDIDIYALHRHPSPSLPFWRTPWSLVGLGSLIPREGDLHVSSDNLALTRFWDKRAREKEQSEYARAPSLDQFAEEQFKHNRLLWKQLHEEINELAKDMMKPT